MQSKIKDITDDSLKTEKVTTVDSSTSNNVEVKLVTDYSFQKDHKYEIEVNTVDNKGYSSDYTKIKIIVKSNSEEKNNIMGDINGDNVVDKKDVDEMLDIIKNNKELPDSFDYNKDGKKDLNDYINLSKDAYGYILGDANDDGKVNVSDRTTIQNYIIEKIQSPYKTNGHRNSDFNSDGKIDNQDYLNIQYIISW